MKIFFKVPNINYLKQLHNLINSLRSQTFDFFINYIISLFFGFIQTYQNCLFGSVMKKFSNKNDIKYFLASDLKYSINPIQSRNLSFIIYNLDVFNIR